MPITLEDINAFIYKGVVTNYTALPSATSVPNSFYWVQNSQGTKWLPLSLGGTYYNSGTYHSNGSTWEYIETPNQATQVTMDAGLNNDQFGTAKTINDLAKWATKEDYVTPSFTNSYYRGDKTFQPLTTAVVPPSTNRNYLTDTQQTNVSNLSGTNTGDETISSIKTKLGIASASQDGYLLQADWNTFNNKVDKSGSTMTGLLILSGDAVNPLGATTLQQLATKEPIITASGNVTDFWSGIKTFRNLATDVRATLLTGLSLATSQTIAATDTILQAFGYLQAQITVNTSNISTNTTSINTKVTGPASATDNAITRYDTTTGKLVQDSLTKINDDGSITFTSVTSPTYNAWTITPDATNRCFTAYNADTGVSMQIGKEGWITFYNNSGTQIDNGKAVYVSGYDATNDRLTIGLADASDATKTLSLGLATETIPNLSSGEVNFWGDVHGLDTSALTAGVTVFLSSTTPGGLTTIAPLAPNYQYRIGKVGRSHVTLGWIQVTPSTARLGNGTANQVLGMNNAGTAQEVKTVASSSTITVTHTTNTITPTIPADVSLSGNPTTTTQSQANNSTRIATTAYVDTGLATKQNIYPIMIRFTSTGPADATTYYTSVFESTLNTTATARNFRFVNNGTVVGFLFNLNQTINGSNETVTINLRNITDGTSTLITTFTSDFGAAATGVIRVTGLNISVLTTKNYSIEIVCPTWVTNPTAWLGSGMIYEAIS